jgi:hypothetical protein
MGLDPNYLYDNADVLWYGTEGYANALGALMKVTGKSEEAVNYMLRGQYGAADFWAASQALEDYGVVAAYNTNGYRCFAFADKVTETVPTGPMYQLDSNATATTVVNAAPVYDVYVDDVAGSSTEGKVLVDAVGSSLPSSHGFYGWKFFAGECLQGLSAAGLGISLGKIIDGALYNANPDFWDANGMKSLDPTTWNTITNGDDSFAAGLFNTIFGLDPNSGKGQMLVDQNALAYLAMWLNESGFFAEGSTYMTSSVVDGVNYNVPIPFANLGTPSLQSFSTTNPNLKNYVYPVPVAKHLQDGTLYFWINKNHYEQNLIGNVSDVVAFQETDSSLVMGLETTYSGKVTCGLCAYNPDTATYSGMSSGSLSYINNGVRVFFDSTTGNYIRVLETIPQQPSGVNVYKIIHALLHGEVRQDSALDGITNQEGATLPDTSAWNDVPSTLHSLQNQYPSMFADAVPNTIVQPDGSTQVITYVPVAMPDAKNQWDTQPISSTTSQTNPEVEPLPQPTTENNDLLKLILQLITMPEPQPDPQTQTETETTPQPPIPDLPTTGDGSSPTPTAPTGSASALWSVYHPTQAQINSFGAWLWGSVFTTDIRKLFEDPIQGVIKLHKVFAPPVDSGTGNIVVGTLDSGVSSATVNQQYVEVDCGSVSCAEAFGSVFDYPPFTDVSLYLPFIGIVPLDVNDVMRSTIHVTYGVDVFTGACLAIVEITRDSNSVVMYQYSGMCSVDYPLTNLQASQMAAGLLGIAAGLAGLASGGTLAPALGLAGGTVATMKRSVGRSGSFSGNSGAMGIKVPYLIFQRPQPKTASTFPRLSGYPTNYSIRLGECSNHVVCKEVHVSGINATLQELEEIERLLKTGIEI